MNILALDLGTTTGYALSPTIGAILSGTWQNKGGRYEGGGMRFLRFRGHLDEIHKLAPLEAVYFEEVRRHAGTDAAHIYGGMLAVLTSWCEEHAIPYSGVPVQTIKKSLTGKGNASKDDMIAGIRALGYVPQDDNEADAIALLLHVRSTPTACDTSRLPSRLNGRANLQQKPPPASKPLCGDFTMNTVDGGGDLNGTG